ncbi:histidine kinase dimerization/phosphoacceptor domain-containing protein [Streptomyces sp. NPDC051219]|uniref:sensor histidine kinase n=1 Tax=Streptomyces sp. NPDC051219 TaxID=3155283 RepID=UPI0034351401
MTCTWRTAVRAKRCWTQWDPYGSWVYRAGAGERAERLEREQHLVRRQARMEERSRIAREMHDVVAHRVGLTVIHSGAVEVGAGGMDQAAETGRLIGDIGGQALDELRQVLGVLRLDDGEEAAPRAPQPTVDDVSALVEQSRATGMRIELTTNMRETPRPAWICDAGPTRSTSPWTMRCPPRPDRASAQWLQRPGRSPRTRHRHGRRVRGPTTARRRIPGPGSDTHEGGGPMSIRVLLAGDEDLVGSGPPEQADPAISVVAEAGNGAEAAHPTRAHRPDSSLWTSECRVMDGLAAIAEITKLPDSPKVVVLTTSDLAWRRRDRGQVPRPVRDSESSMKARARSDRRRLCERA